MLKHLLKNNVWGFAAGVAATVIGGKVLKSQAVHDAVVKTVAKGLIIKDEAQEKLANIKEQSQDIYAEAVAEKQRRAAQEFATEVTETALDNHPVEA